jgi:putative membrane protein
MSFVPYCGAPPVPGTLAWNMDPVLIGVLAASAFTFFKVAPPADRRRLCFFTLGWILLALALIGPLCNLSVALFSARVTQHMLLVLAAAPLVAAGICPARVRGASSLEVWTACGVFLGVIWLWHSPLPYDESLRDNAVYWAMQLSIIGSAIWLWSAIFRSNALCAFLAASFTGVQMSLLGALLTFARDPLFSVHEFTTSPWGLGQLQDQQLGGLVMWIPAGLLLTAYSIAALGLALTRMNARDAGQPEVSASSNLGGAQRYAPVAKGA